MSRTSPWQPVEKRGLAPDDCEKPQEFDVYEVPVPFFNQLHVQGVIAVHLSI